jgi:hypothetical protein
VFRKITAVYSENNKKLINTLCGHNAEFLKVKAFSRYGNHFLLKG